MKGIKSVAKHAVSKDNLKLKKLVGEMEFQSVAGNNKVVATSQSYADRSSMNKGIKSVMTNAPKLKIS